MSATSGRVHLSTYYKRAAFLNNFNCDLLDKGKYKSPPRAEVGRNASMQKSGGCASPLSSPLPPLCPSLFLRGLHGNVCA